MPLELKTIAILLTLLGAVGAVVGYGHGRYNAGAAAVQARWDADTAVRIAAAQKAEAENRQIEQQRQTTINEVTKDAQTQIDQARAAAAAASHAADGLRQQLASYVARHRGAPGHPDATGSGQDQQNPDPADLLAQLFTEADDAAGAMAGYADRLRIAGSACERAYDALRAH